MNTLIQPLAAGIDRVSTQLIVHADGIITTANGFNNELYALVVNGGLTVIVVLFLVAAFKKGSASERSSVVCSSRLWRTSL